MPWATRAFRTCDTRGYDVTAGGLLTRLDPIPKALIHDPQFGNLFDDPVLGGVQARLSFAGGRVLYETLAVPDQAADIEFIVQDAGAAPPVAVDGGHAPALAARPIDPVGVERARDCARATAGREFLENAPNDGRLILVDHPFARRHRPIASYCAHHVVAVCHAAGGLAFADPPLKAPVGLLGEVLEEQAAHRPLEADVQFGNLALGDRDNRYPLKPHPLEEGGDMFLIPAETVEALGDNHIETVPPSVLHQALVGWAQIGCAADAAIGIGLRLPPALALDQTQAQAVLILDRGVALQIGGISGVYCCAHGSGLFLIAVSDITGR